MLNFSSNHFGYLLTTFSANSTFAGCVKNPGKSTVQLPEDTLGVTVLKLFGKQTRSRYVNITYKTVKLRGFLKGSMVNEAMEKNAELQEITRFLHYYTRFRNHENSQKMEEPLLTSVKKKMEVLASSLGIRREGKFVT